MCISVHLMPCLIHFSMYFLQQLQCIALAKHLMIIAQFTLNQKLSKDYHFLQNLLWNNRYFFWSIKLFGQSFFINLDLGCLQWQLKCITITPYHKFVDEYSLFICDSSLVSRLTVTSVNSKYNQACNFMCTEILGKLCQKMKFCKIS